MDISVVVPVYNVEKYFPKCLDSLIAQDGCVKEIILVNDGSTDNSLAIAQAYAQKDRRIKIICQENKGVSSAICLGVNSATCDYIGFVDADDYIEPDMFGLMADKMTESNADIVFCDYDTVSEDGQQLSENNIDVHSECSVFTKENGVFPLRLLPTVKYRKFLDGFRCNKLFKKSSIVNNISFKDFGIRVGEDIAMVVPIFFASERVAFVRKSLYHYVQRGTSLVHTYKRQNVKDWSLIIDVLDRARKEYNYKIENFDDVSLALALSICMAKVRIATLSLKQKKEEYRFIGENERIRQLLKTVKLKTSLKYKIAYSLLKWRMYGLLALA